VLERSPRQDLAKALQPPPPSPFTEENLIVVTAWASHDAFDAWIETPDRDRLTASDVHSSVEYGRVGSSPRWLRRSRGRNVGDVRAVLPVDLLGAPFIESLRGKTRLSNALTTITAAIVGVVLNLALWFAINTLFSSVREVTAFGGSVPVPVWTSVDWFAVAVAAVAFVGLWRYRWNVIPVVAVSALGGLVYTLAR
jgi:hypothetical protein